MTEPTDNQTAYGTDQDREPPSSGMETGQDTSERDRDRDHDRGEYDPDDRRDAEQAHGGSMAPGLVDATGKQVVNPPPSGDDE